LQADDGEADVAKPFVLRALEDRYPRRTRPERHGLAGEKARTVGAALVPDAKDAGAAAHREPGGVAQLERFAAAEAPNADILLSHRAFIVGTPAHWRQRQLKQTVA
jgi:hypothetical protein